MPDTENEAFDPSTATIEERVARLEHLVGVVAGHQSGLGSSLIRAHKQLVAISADLLDAGIATGDKSQPNSAISIDRAPLITPGGHPLRKN